MTGPRPATVGDRPDPELLRRARDGDREAFALLHTRYRRVVHGLLLARVSREEADDLVQEVFLIALDRVGELKDDAAFGAWLCAIARNRATDAQRRGQRLKPWTDAGLRGEPQPPRAEAAEALDAIRSLPEAYAETLIMRLVEDLSGPEIAERTGLTEGSVRVNLHRGMALLRERLEGTPLARARR